MDCVSINQFIFFFPFISFCLFSSFDFDYYLIVFCNFFIICLIVNICYFQFIINLLLSLLLRSIIDFTKRIKCEHWKNTPFTLYKMQFCQQTALPKCTFAKMHFCQNTLCQNALLPKYTFCQNTLGQNTLCQNTLCQNALCQNTLCQNTLCQNTLFAKIHFCQNTL